MRIHSDKKKNGFELKFKRNKSTVCAFFTCHSTKNFKILIDQVTSDMKIQISLVSPTDNEDIEITEFSVRTANGAIVIASPTRSKVQIIDFSGRILRGFEVPAGTTYCTGFSKGFYVVRSEFGTVKIAL